MTLKNAKELLKSLLSETHKKSEIKVYREFIQILSGLEERNLSEAEIQSIESKLDDLQLDSIPTNQRRFAKKALIQFKKFLKDTYALTTRGYYTNLGIGLGSSFGVLFGIVFLAGFERSLGISAGISLGLLIGLVIGRQMDIQASASGKMV